MEDDAREALRFFRRARAVAKRAHYEFAAWYVAGNIERLEILLGHAERAVPAIRKRLKILQKRGAQYDEIVTRSNLAWGLRTLGHHREALHELDVALNLARETGTFNVLLEFLEYDRSIVLAALGDTTGAQASYRRYLRLVGAWNRNTPALPAGDTPGAIRKRPLEPFFLKSADRFILEHIGETLAVARLAEHCGVSQRTLEKPLPSCAVSPPLRTCATCGSIMRAAHSTMPMPTSPRSPRVSAFAAQPRSRSNTANASAYRPAGRNARCRVSPGDPESTSLGHRR